MARPGSAPRPPGGPGVAAAPACTPRTPGAAPLPVASAGHRAAPLAAAGAAAAARRAVRAVQVDAGPSATHAHAL